jgi:hypothetical protein
MCYLEPHSSAVRHPCPDDAARQGEIPRGVYPEFLRGVYREPLRFRSERFQKERTGSEPALNEANGTVRSGRANGLGMTDSWVRNDAVDGLEWGAGLRAEAGAPGFGRTPEIRCTLGCEGGHHGSRRPNGPSRRGRKAVRAFLSVIPSAARNPLCCRKGLMRFFVTFGSSE